MWSTAEKGRKALHNKLLLWIHTSTMEVFSARRLSGSGKAPLKGEFLHELGTGAFLLSMKSCGWVAGFFSFCPTEDPTGFLGKKKKKRK